MPIVQAFCPDTGAAIGGGCGPAEPSGGGLYKTALEQVNLTDGSWTLFDPDNLVQSVSHAAGVNKVVWNALPVGSQNYRWDAGGQHRAPRWYKDNNIDGNRVNSMDFNIFTSVIENVDAVSDFNNQIVCGVSQIPTGLEIFQVDFTGGAVTRLAGSGTFSYGPVTYNAGAINPNNGRDVGVVTVMRGGNALGSGCGLAIQKSDGRVLGTQNSRNSNQFALNNANPQDNFVMVGVGIRINNDTVAAGDEQNFKMWFSSYVPDVQGAY